MKRKYLALLLLAPLLFAAAAKITNVNIASDADISWSKMAALTASRVACISAGGAVEACTMPSSYLDATSSIQTQIDGKQASDADLTALAALSGTSTIYYRSAANTWSPVTFSANCSLTAGELDCADGGGSSSLSLVHLHTGNGHGAVNTKIRRFTTAVTNTGTAITYADTANDGASFTINEDGVYVASYSDFHNSSTCAIGFSKNSNQLTTEIYSITAAHIMSTSVNESSSLGHVSAVFSAVATDVIRPHTQGNCNGTAATTNLMISKVVDL